jgi:hypothetical protein
MTLKIFVADDSVTIQKVVGMAFSGEDVKIEAVSRYRVKGYMSFEQPGALEIVEMHWRNLEAQAALFSFFAQHKDYLPHHRKGAADSGGDNYAVSSWPKGVTEVLLDFANRHRDSPYLYRSAGDWRNGVSRWTVAVGRDGRRRQLVWQRHDLANVPRSQPPYPLSGTGSQASRPFSLPIPSRGHIEGRNPMPPGPIPRLGQQWPAWIDSMSSS